MTDEDPLNLYPTWILEYPTMTSKTAFLSAASKSSIIYEVVVVVVPDEADEPERCLLDKIDMMTL